MRVRVRGIAVAVGACLLLAGCGPRVALTAAEVAATTPTAAAHPRRPTENLGSAMLQLACDHALGARWHLIRDATVQPGPDAGATMVYRIHGMGFDFERTPGGRSAVIPEGTNAGAALLLASGALVLPPTYCRLVFPQPARRTAVLALSGAQAACRARERPAAPCRALGAAGAVVRRLRTALGRLG